TWLCRDQRLAMNRCMVAHASQDELDRARDEWFATAGDRRRKREEEALDREEKLKLKREYWGVDEAGRPLDKSKGEPNR
ncbi:MAG: hypothetical protein INR71_08060, partial [Terriglobus roseus]|nr:hypothetical protein [Terriglobus roseus]